MTDWLVDTHCHLDLIPGITSKYLEEDGLPIKTISVTNAPSFFQHSQKLFKDAKNVRIAVGMHPELVSQFHGELVLFKSLLSETRYVGEIGLDGSDRFKSSFELQLRIFTELVRACAETNDKVITLHTRNAEKEAIHVLKSLLVKSECRVILHWFTGNVEALREAVKAGFYFSINHKMTMTKKGQELIKHVPINLLLTETDAPFTLDGKLSRLDSLNRCINALGRILDKRPEDLRIDILNNFRQLLI